MIHLERGEDLSETYSRIPSQVGVLQFHESESTAAIEAIDALADPEVLDALTTERDFVKNNSPLGVKAAVDKVSNVDMSTVDETTGSI